MKSSRLGLSFWIGLFLFSVYLLSFSGKLHIMDEFVGFAVGNNWVQHGRPDVNQFIWTNHWHATPPGVWGNDGNLYTKKAPGISLAAAPLIWLGHTLPGLNAVHLSLLTSAIVTAFTGSLLFLWLVDLNFSNSVAGLTALAYGLCTIALVYARLLWEHSVMALVFLLAVWAIYRAIYKPDTQHRWFWVALCGVAAAVALTMRFEAAVAVALFGVLIFFYAPPSLQNLSLSGLLRLLQNKRRWLWSALYLVAPFLTVLWLLYFNYSRFGSISETGYNREILFQKPWVGAFGLLFSPSTGLFIYVPLMLLMFVGLRPAWRRLPHPYFWLIMGLTLFYWIFYGAWFSWGSTWVWGPRFLLHTLPLLMVLIAEAFTLIIKMSTNPSRWLAWLGVAIVAAAGFFINFLGVVVDLNEHFLRLGRNDNFVFNWEAFPPLGHWRILLEGLTDIIWLRPGADGFSVEWSVLGPMLLLLGLATVGLGAAILNSSRKASKGWLARFAHHPLLLAVVCGLALLLLYQSMRGTAQVSLAGEQAQADASLLNTLTHRAMPQDSLLIAMPPFGDVQEISTHVMAYLDQPLPTYAWIETEPRAIQPQERQRVWQSALAQTDRTWLFERWLTPGDPFSPTALQFNRQAFPVEEQWFDRSGKLTLFALPKIETPSLSLPLDVPFQGGVTLVGLDVFNNPTTPGKVLKIRLTWRAAEAGSALGLPRVGVVSFVHLVDNNGQNVAQQDRLLLDLQNPRQSLLLPEQTVSQGYGLQLPANLPPGSYSLIAGLYLANSGQRLVRADDSPDDFLYLTDVTVQQK